MNTKKVLTLGFGAAALAGVLGGGSLLAQGNSAASALTGGVANVVQQVNPAAGNDHKAEQDAYLQSLATRLGISVDTLKQAMKDTSIEKLAQMVTDGKLTQEQADKITAGIESGDHLFPGAGPMKGGRGGHEGPGGPGGPGAHDQAALATFLGVDEATLRTELQAGKSLATIATEHGKTRDQLKSFLTDQMSAELAQKVADGKITQAQADEMKAKMTASLDAMVDGTGRGPGGPGAAGGHDGPKGGHGGPGMRQGGGTPPGAQGS